MARLIDADALIEKEERSELDRYIDGERCYQMVVPSWAIIEAPTIDAVSVVHGEWIKEGCAKGSEMCNQCGFVQFEGRVDNFCPNCGSKMRGEHDAVDVIKKPLVRCKDCKWLRYCETEDLELYLDCDNPDGGGIPRSEEWFCADGERKE